MILPASYYDGKSSRRHAVELMYHNGVLAISGDVRRVCQMREVHVLERIHSATRKLVLPDGAYLEVMDAAGFDTLIAEMGYRDPIAVRIHQRWRTALVAFALFFAVMVPSYLYGLPVASKFVAMRLPESAQRAIGRESLSFLDGRFFLPSELTPDRQKSIVNRFKALSPPRLDSPKYEIIFRKSRIGPNAFALPSGQIVMTDELVKLLADDDAIIGVLAHELGHLHERHLLQRIIQGSVVGFATMVLFGDVSSVVAAIPTTLLDLKYSRDAEREADDYAIAMMKVNGIGLEGLRLTFEKLGKKSPGMNSYLSSHPSTAERIERINKAK